MTTKTYIGLGSNLGDSRQILSEAIAKLKTLGGVKVSKLYQSPPMGPQDQPNYLNAVAELNTDLMPLDLLDLDLLIYGDEKIQNERLTVPHIGILERDFVVIPLLDLDADLHINDQPLKNLELIQQPTLTVLADESWA